ncbi:hypothetical protein J2128_001352 [Methanomicrobium sp. W14]|uniref:hypothetical protein n=1 Tax=Methanomicrobium sp. W14 TaxID=2817839 RepID=UPI001AE5A771|nr:hypothetical protein [Methanomicrobium sp. W14]MBP2133398.1 hypothetical protein [Methanomicrobium sp. W14]
MKRLKYLLGKYHIDVLTPAEESELKEIIIHREPRAAEWTIKEIYDLGLVIVGADCIFKKLLA